jgi:hypothetical protein
VFLVYSESVCVAERRWQRLCPSPETVIQRRRFDQASLNYGVY